jgi:maleate isomerase
MSTPRRIGMIVPSSNVTMETEVPAVLRRHERADDPGFSFHSSRAVLHTVDEESLRRMVHESERCARELADAHVDVVAYACLIAVMAEGAGAHERHEARLAETLREAGTPAPVTSSAGALVRTLQDLGASRVAIAAPYVKPLTAKVVSYLGGYGIEVVDSISLEVADNVAVGRLDQDALVDHVGALQLDGVDALVVSACVQMPSLAVVDRVERAVDVPVLSAATATAREVLQLLGEPPEVPGAGAALGAPAVPVPR